MIEIKELIWDDWNREHIGKHEITPEEVEEICNGKHEEIESYRNRIQLSGTTNKGKKLTIILSPEDRNLRKYGNGIYYPVTAFEEVN